jgi:ribokinase
MAQIFVLGSFVVDLTCYTPHLPKRGETVFAGPFRMGAGGKGSNQAIAAARSGGAVYFMTKLGADDFGDMARRTLMAENVDCRYVVEDVEHETGAALIMVENETAENMITVSVGACNHITLAEVQNCTADIANSKLFVTQLETNMQATEEGIKVARAHRVPTLLNPAPVQALNHSVYPDITYFTPNETEASELSGIEVTDIKSAEAAAGVFLARGVKNVIITLGEEGALVKNKELCEHIPAFNAGKAVDTTGAGDAFNGGFATAIAEGKDLLDAVRFGCATAAISVTKPGTAVSMPKREKIEALLAGIWQRTA